MIAALSFIMYIASGRNIGDDKIVRVFMGNESEQQRRKRQSFVNRGKRQ
jgi:hypothetical protein